MFYYAFAVLYSTDVGFFLFLQTEGKTLHQQNYDLLYCSALELNQQYLQAMPVVFLGFLNSQYTKKK